jgi:EmrB/QacA subfamily drug resistance transporter
MRNAMRIPEQSAGTTNQDQNIAVNGNVILYWIAPTELQVAPMQHIVALSSHHDLGTAHIQFGKRAFIAMTVEQNSGGQGPRSAPIAARLRRHEMAPDKHYKWVALSNTTLGVLMATVNSSIILIAMPAIFTGIGINPLAPGETNYFLWLLLGYMVVTATLLVTFGRISDIFGRVKLYNLGFAIFTLGSILLFITPGRGDAGALQMVIFRLIQGVGAGFLFANSTAILTDAFPSHQRGMAMGINQVAAIVGSLAGLILGGILATFNWRLVFLVSVPIGIFGTIWAFLMLRETATMRGDKRIDWPGNLTFAVGLTVLLLGITYGIEPYGNSPMGWGNPGVIAAIVVGVLLLLLFIWIELRSSHPMFRLELFRIRMFSFGNASVFLSSLAQGGLQFMIVIWLQGIWLPLHGYSFEETPLWAGIYMIPLMIGFIVMGPLSGLLSDRFGSRLFSTLGMILMASGFLGLTALPADFSYAVFAPLLLLLGIGQGMFAAPNTTAIMNSVPPEHRGVASGMRATFQNAASLLSIGVFFSIVTAGLAAALPSSLFNGLSNAGLPAPLATAISHLPPTAALFAAFLGYNPMGSLLPSAALHSLPASSQAALLSKEFFPNLIASPFMVGLHAVFYIAAGMCVVAAVASYFRGRRYIHGQDDQEDPLAEGAVAAGDTVESSSILEPAD